MQVSAATGEQQELEDHHAGQPIQPPSKRPHLDSGEAGLWPYAAKNKPVGIAQPFQKKESVEVEPMEKSEGVFKLEQEVDLKADISLDPKVKAGMKSIEKPVDLGADKASRKLSGKRKLSAESDSDSDSSSEAPSESSDDAGPSRPPGGERRALSAKQPSGDSGRRKDEDAESRTSSG